MNKQGALLIEVILATAITSLLMAGLMTSIYQLNKAQVSMDRRIEAYTRASLIFHQLEHDLTGVFLPIQNKIAREKEKKGGVKPSLPPSQQTPAAQANEQDSEKKKEVKSVEDIFIGTQEGENLNLLSCVTTNPVTVFWSEQSGKPKPRAARVIYRLQRDPQKEPVSFALMRQEGEELSLKTYEAQDTKARSYELASGIKGMRIEYIVAKKSEKKDTAAGDKQAVDASKPREYETKFEWKVKEIKSDNKQEPSDIKAEPSDQKQASQEKEEPMLIPQYVRITLELWDAAFKNSQEFNTTVCLVSSTQNNIQSKAPVRPPSASNEKKPTSASPQKTAQAHSRRMRRSYTGPGVRVAHRGQRSAGVHI